MNCFSKTLVALSLITFAKGYGATSGDRPANRVAMQTIKKLNSVIVDNQTQIKQLKAQVAQQQAQLASCGKSVPTRITTVAKKATTAKK